MMGLVEKSAMVSLSTVMLDVSKKLSQHSGVMLAFVKAAPGFATEFQRMSKDLDDLAQQLQDAIISMPASGGVEVVQALPAPQLIAMYTDQMDRLYELIQLSMRPQVVSQNGPYTDQEVDGLMAKVRGEGS